MRRAEGYANEISSIQKEMKRLQSQIKNLREQKKNAESHLYKYMSSTGINKIQTITIKSITPKEKVIRKKKADKVRDAIQLFEDIGVPDPERFYQDFLETQKYRTTEL